MLINALRRLNQYLHPCEFILPGKEGMPLPNLPPNVTIIPPLHLIFRLCSFSIRVILLVGRWQPRLKQFLSKINDGFAWRCSSRLIDFVLRLQAIRMVPRLGKTIRTFVEAVSSCDAFYGVGTANLNDHNLSGLVYKCLLLRAIRPYVRVSVLSAQGIGPLETPWARQWVTRALGQLDLLSFRDCYFSFNLVNKLDPEHVRYEIVADEAWSLPVAPCNQIESYLQEIGIQPKQPFVAFHFRMTDCTQDTTAFIPHVASILDAIHEVTSYPIVFFPMSYHTQSDEICGRAIQGTMKKRGQMTVAPLCKNVGLVKGAVGCARYTLGLSYHIHVFSLSQGHPALVLYSGDYYRYKSEGLVGFYGPPNVALNIQKVNCQEVVRAVERIEADYQQTCLSIQRTNEKIALINDRTLKEMAHLLHRADKPGSQFETEPS